MFGLFKKKLSDEEAISQNIAQQQAEAQEDTTKKKEDDMGDSKIAMEVTKIKAQLEGLNEQRQAVNERFTKINEEIGEIRGMVMDTNKAVGNIEASATKAIDVVESVEPDKLMGEVRKQDGKTEALKANIESNETLMKDMMSEVKEIRKRMDFFKGVEQLVKMNNEIKQELIDIKKIEGNVQRQGSKVETIFIEVEKKFGEFDRFNDVTKDLKKSMDKLQGDVDKLRVKIEDKSDRKELNKYIKKFNDFEKHTTNVINLLDERSKNSVDTITSKYQKLVSNTESVLNSAIQQLGLEAEKAGKEVPASLKPKKSWKDFFKRDKKQTEQTQTPSSEQPPKEEAETQQPVQNPPPNNQPSEGAQSEQPSSVNQNNPAPQEGSSQAEQTQPGENRTNN